MGYQKIKAFGWIVFEIIDRLAGSETSLDPNTVKSAFSELTSARGLVP